MNGIGRDWARSANLPSVRSSGAFWSRRVKSISFKRHRFPEVIRQAAWLYFRFALRPGATRCPRSARIWHRGEGGGVAAPSQ